MAETADILDDSSAEAVPTRGSSQENRGVQEGQSAAPDGQSTTSSRLPNGRFAPGRSGNPKGRPKRKVFSEYSHEWLEGKPTTSELELVAEATGLELKDLETCTSRYQIQAMVHGLKAMLGNVESLREQQDRLDPKINHRKVESDVTLTPAMAPTGDDPEENQAAADYMARVAEGSGG